MSSHSQDEEYKDLTAELAGPPRDHVPPDELFHYTSAGGLLEIVQSNRIWASNLEFMNDFLEVKYAKELFMEVVQRERKTVRGRGAFRFLEQTARLLYPFTNVFSFYAVSFCADGGDRLSQWRGYAGEGTGYSIGLRTAELMQVIQNRRTATGEEQMELIEVVYGREQQETIVEDAVRKICRYIEAHPALAGNGDSEQVSEVLPKLLCVHLFPYVFSFKAAGFEEEKEWRLVTWMSSAVEAKEVNFRASANFTIPYLSLDLSLDRSGTAGKLPISKIIQGPRVEAEVGMKSLELLIKKYGHSEATVLPSKIPLRYVT